MPHTKIPFNLRICYMLQARSFEPSQRGVTQSGHAMQLSSIDEECGTDRTTSISTRGNFFWNLVTFRWNISGIVGILSESLKSFQNLSKIPKSLESHVKKSTYSPLDSNGELKAWLHLPKFRQTHFSAIPEYTGANGGNTPKVTKLGRQVYFLMQNSIEE